MTPTEIEKLKERIKNGEPGAKIFFAGTVELLIAALEAKDAEIERLTKPRYITEWHEDMGQALWWHYPIQEAPYVGSPLDDDFDDNWHTWWTPLPDSRAVNAAFEKVVADANAARALLSKQDSGERP